MTRWEDFTGPLSDEEGRADSARYGRDEWALYDGRPTRAEIERDEHDEADAA